MNLYYNLDTRWLVDLPEALPIKEVILKTNFAQQEDLHTSPGHLDGTF